MKPGRFLIFLLCAAAILPNAPFTRVSAEKTNLARGKAVTVQSDAANGRSYNELQRFEPEKLTDGEYGSADYGDARWNKFYRAVGRTLVVDLGENCTAEGVRARFLHNNRAGVTSPRRIEVFVSQNGVDFARAKVISGGKPPFAATYGDKTEIAVYELALEPVAARFVALHFDVTVNTFIDEIEVSGTKGCALAPPSDFVDIVKNENAFYPRDGLGGDHDIVLFHAGYSPDNESLVNNTEDQFFSYIAYTDPRGKPLDTMFDSVMFLTLQGKCPSGGDLTISGGKTVISDWECLLDSYFSQEYNLGALERAAKKLKTELSLPQDKKISVYLTAPYPKTGTPDFGDIDGDGVSDGINDYADCLKATEWFIAQCESRWEAAGYENLAFKGFFCNSEGLTRSRFDYEEQYAADAAAIMHSHGKLCVMIPYYHGEGIDRYRELGLDAALMQPNLSFNETLRDDPEGAMLDFAETAKRFGLGIEMEIADGVRWEPEKLGAFYEQYLVTAAQTGLMTDTVHAYYNGAGPGVFYDCAVSTDKSKRKYYDLTYKFIKGRLEYPADYGVSETKTVFSTSGEKVTGELGVSGDWSFEIALSAKPKNGYVLFDETAHTFSYTPDRHFSGADGFSYTVSLGGEEIVTREIKIDVLREGGEDSAPESTPLPAASLPPDAITGADRSATRIAVYSLAGAAALALGIFCAACGVKALKKRKKGDADR